jgi:hypothetical protein
MHIRDLEDPDVDMWCFQHGWFAHHPHWITLPLGLNLFAGYEFVEIWVN